MDVSYMALGCLFSATTLGLDHRMIKIKWGLPPFLKKIIYLIMFCFCRNKFNFNSVLNLRSLLF